MVYAFQCKTTKIIHCTKKVSHSGHKTRAAPIPGIGIGPMPAFLMVSESVKYVIHVPILLFVHY